MKPGSVKGAQVERNALGMRKRFWERGSHGECKGAGREHKVTRQGGGSGAASAENVKTIWKKILVSSFKFASLLI